MIGEGSIVEKRKHKRFKAQIDTNIAIINDSCIVGQILNISIGGLAFKSIDKGEKITGWYKANMFRSSKNSFIKEVMFKCIWEENIVSKIPFSTLLMKQCGGQFGALTDDKRSELDNFIANHTFA